MKLNDPKTTLAGFVLIACGAFLIVTSHKVTPDALAIVTAGAGLVAAKDSGK